MARDEFDSAGEYVQVQDLVGKLVLFTPVEYIEEMVTSFKPDGTDVIKTDIVVLDEDGTQTEYDDVLIFQGGLIGKLKKQLTIEKTMDRDPVTGVVSHFETTTTRRILGVVGKGEAKKGQHPPYVIDKATDAQKDLARAYVAENPTPKPVKRFIRQELSLGVTQVPAGSPATPAPGAQYTAQTPAADEFAPDAGEPDPADPWATA